MARPCNAYFELKMPGPRGVITVIGDPKRAEEITNKNVNITDSKAADIEFAAYKVSVDPIEMP